MVGAARLVVSEAALERLTDGGGHVNARQVIIRPVISEKSYALLAANKYTFRVHERSNKTQVRQAVEEIFGVRVPGVRTAWVKPKPKRRGFSTGKRRRWKKAIVTLHPEDSIELFEGQELRPVVAIKRHKPTTPGRRFATWSDNPEVTKSEASPRSRSPRASRSPAGATPTAA